MTTLLFWLVITLMTLAAVAALAFPWLRPACRAPLQRENFNVAVYRDRLEELEAALDYPAFLTYAQREQERSVLMRDLLDDVGDAPAPPAAGASPNPHNGRWALYFLVTALPLTALLLYGLIGDGIYRFAPSEPPASADSAAKTPTIEAMAARLAARLAANPDDQRGWTMLGRSYIVLERYPEAVAAYAQANALGNGQNPELAVDYAEALALANDNQVNEAARNLLAQALEQAPNHPKGLWLMGAWAFQEGRYPAAREFWQRLQAVLPEDSEFINEINGAIAEAQRRATPDANTKSPDQ